MKRQKKQLIVLLILLVVCVAAYIGVTMNNKKTKQEEEASEEAAKVYITDFDKDDVTAFSYVLNGTTLAFHKDGDNWLYDGDSSVDIDEDSVSDLLSQASKMTDAEQLDEVGDLSDYGLDAPANTITIETKDDKITLLVGNCNDMLSEYYMKEEGSDAVYLVDSTTAKLFQKTVESLTAAEDTESTEAAEPEATEENAD